MGLIPFKIRMSLRLGKHFSRCNGFLFFYKLAAVCGLSMRRTDRLRVKSKKGIAADCLCLGARSQSP